MQPPRLKDYLSGCKLQPVEMKEEKESGGGAINQRGRGQNAKEGLMLIKPELIVYMWLFPVFLFFVFPAACYPLIVLGRKLSYSNIKNVKDTQVVFTRGTASLPSSGGSRKMAKR